MSTPRSLRRLHGFTILEMLIVITVVSIVAGSLLPVITRPYVAQYRSQTVAEMQSLEEAIVGHPEIGDYGFIGTMGRLPNLTSLTSPLSELWQMPVTDVSVTTNTHGSLPMGWNGTYLRSQFNRPDLDSWGNPYVIDQPAASNKWRLWSYGPDGTANTPDDIFFPSPDDTGTAHYFLSQANSLTVEVLESDGINVNYMPWSALAPSGSSLAAAATLFLPSQTGSETQTSCTVQPPYPASMTYATRVVCSNIPFGMRHLTLASTATPAGFSQADTNVAVNRQNSWGRIFVSPVATGTNNDGLALSLPVTTTRTVNGAATILAPLANTPPVPPFPMATALDIEVNGTVMVTGSDQKTSCNVWVNITGSPIQWGMVSVRNNNGIEMPFRISVNAGLTSTLQLAAGATPPTFQVMAQAVGGGDSCLFGSSVGADNGLAVYVYHQLQQ